MLNFSKRILFLPLAFLALSVLAQTTISGTVKEKSSGDPLVGVNISIKGTVMGTTTDADGKYVLHVTINPPLTVVFSYIGYGTVEKQITEANNTGVDVSLDDQAMLGQEVVISASKVEEKILESPVSIEKMNILDVQNTTGDNYYKGLANLKGVDVTSSSINFQIINTRGFGSTGNTRFVQLTDGMDTQAPALNFPIGNLNGPSELDVESVELIPGASSALYGPNAFNGMVLITSKNAFEYPGLSAFVKTGVNHIGDDDTDGPKPLIDASFRYAHAFNNRFAFKLNYSYMQAEDWHGEDGTDRQIGRTPEGFSFNPGSDQLHYMGDEAAISLAILRLSTTTDPAHPGWETLAKSSLGTFEPGVTAWSYAQNDWLPSTVVSITPWKEKYLIAYNSKNMKVNGGLYYRITNDIELSYLYNAGFGTSIYTGAQRYSLKNFSIEQHRLQLRGDNFYIRAYTTQENSGDSYIVEFLAKRLNDIRSGTDLSTWLGTYAIYYLRYLYDHGYDDPTVGGNNVTIPIDLQEAAHMYARSQTDAKYPLVPGTDAFNKAKAQAINGVVPFGPKFKDHTAMYHAEGQYDFKNEVKFMDLIAGASYRIFDLNSNGTIFDDLDQNLTISEYGAYAQAGKWLGQRRFRLSGSLRYDKNENFKGQFSPRISGLLKVGEDHNFRISYQTGFRVPDTQGQHIDLNTIQARLLGGLQRYADKYDLVRFSSADAPLTYEGFSVEDYKSAVFSQNATTTAIFNPANVAKLKPITSFTPVKPEQVKSIEVGYKSVLNNKLLIDLDYYYNMYNSFISQVQMVIATELPDGSPNYGSLLYGQALNKESDGSISGNTAQIYTNVDNTVHSEGADIQLTYTLGQKGYNLTGNYSWSVIRDVPEGFLAEFNTPEHKFNIGIGNRKVTDNFGFNLNYRWQSRFLWESSFTIPANGYVPAFGTLDAQVSVKVPKYKTIVKVGGSDLLNKYHICSLGGPAIGGIYYVSLTFNEKMN